MNQHTPAVRQALFNAVHGLTVPMADVGDVIKSIHGFTTTSNAHDTAMLGNFAIKLLLDRLMTDLRAERESAMLVDKLRSS